MTNTQYYSLRKPAGTDYVDVGDINYNSDKIDELLHTIDEALAANDALTQELEERLNNLRCYKLISSQTAPSGDTVAVDVSGINWNKWQQVIVTVDNCPIFDVMLKLNSTSAKNGQWSVTPTVSDAADQGFSGHSDLCCGRLYSKVPWVPGLPSPVTLTGKTNGRFVFSPNQTPNNYVRVTTESTAIGRGGSGSLRYVDLNTLYLYAPGEMSVGTLTPGNLQGAVIRVWGVDGEGDLN